MVDLSKEILNALDSEQYDEALRLVNVTKEQVETRSAGEQARLFANIAWALCRLNSRQDAVELLFKIPLDAFRALPPKQFYQYLSIRGYVLYSVTFLEMALETYELAYEVASSNGLFSESLEASASLLDVMLGLGCSTTEIQERLDRVKQQMAFMDAASVQAWVQLQIIESQINPQVPINPLLVKIRNLNAKLSVAHARRLLRAGDESSALTLLSEANLIAHKFGLAGVIHDIEALMRSAESGPV